MSERERDRREFVRRWGRVVAIVLVAVVVLLALRFEADVFFLILAGSLFALALSGTARAINRHVKLGYKTWVAILTIALVAAVVGGGWLLGGRIVAQVEELVQRIPQLIAQARHGLAQYPVVQQATPTPQQVMPKPEAAVGGATGAIAAVAHGMAAVVVIFFVGLYGALFPEAYPKIALRLVPIPRRPRFAQILDETATSLRRWLLGRVVAMATVGVLVSIGLFVLGIPLALGVGVLAGLATFIEYVGAIATAVPAVLLALTKSPMAALWTLVIFTAAHVIEGYIITPLITKRMVRLAPAYTLSAQAIFGSVFGVIGLTFATPVMVTATILVRSLYVEDLLGDRERHEPRSASASEGERTMNWDRIAGNWQAMKGHLRQKWAKLTDSDVDAVGGTKDKLLGVLRERYGYAKDKAEQELNDFLAGMKEEHADAAARTAETPTTKTTPVERPSRRDLH